MITTYKLINEKSGNPEVVEVPKVRQDRERRDQMTPMDHEMFHKALAARGIYHVPKNIYQIMYDMGPRNDHPLEIQAAQDRARKFLLSWVEDNFPNQQLDNFYDFSTKEAQAIHPSLNWGMYIKVSPKGEMIGNDIIAELKLLCR